MIYIDPPYNTGNDFVYCDNFTDKCEKELLESGQVDELKRRLVPNPTTEGRYHSNWLSMMYPRLKLARNLLTDDGVIFISIDDHEVHNLRKLCDEIFGETNFVAQCIRRTINSGKHDTMTIALYHEYVLVYAKTLQNLILNKRIKSEKERDTLYKESDKYEKERGRYYVSQLNKNSIQYSDSLNFPIQGPDGIDIYPGSGFDDKSWCWRWGREKVNWGILNGYIVFKKQGNKYKVYAKSYEFCDNSGNPIGRTNPYSTLEFVAKEYGNFNATPELSSLFEGRKYFDFPKSQVLLGEILRLANCREGIILDFFSGSATTAHAVMQLNAEDGGNRKFIMIQLPERTNEDSEAFNTGYKTICDIGKERIRRAGKKILEEKMKANDDIGQDRSLDVGFRVYRLDSSNMKDVYHHPQDYKQGQLDAFADNIKPDRTADDLLAQVMLSWGLSLSLTVERMTVVGKEVFCVAENSLYACFDKGINEAFVEEIAKDKPLRVLFRDNAFENDTVKANVQQLLKQLSPETEMKVI
jgi:adenine-specific DNA-methyltransferase